MHKILFSLFLAVLSVAPLYVFSQKKYPPERPKLIVAIVVDGMRYEAIQRYWNKYSENGFKKLIYKGAFCRDATYPQLYHSASSNHASLSTGTSPSSHGMIADKWFNRLKNKEINSTEDGNYSTVGSGGNAGKRSPILLLSSTIGDELMLSTLNQSKVISIAQNPSSAVLMAGHIATGVYWVNKENGNWISSSYFTSSLPAWVDEFNNKGFADLYLNRQWTTSIHIEQYTESLPDDTPYELGYGRNNKVFPYNLVEMKKERGDYSLLESTIFGNTYTKDLAIAAILGENLGKDETPDLLWVSFSSTAAMLQKFSPSSLEMQEAYLQLDADLAHFTDFIENEIGKENVLFMITASHGAPEAPAYMATKGYDVDYFEPQKAVGLLSAYMKAIYGKGNWVQYYKNQQIYLDRSLIEEARIPLHEIQSKVAQFMVQISGVSNAIATGTLENNSQPYGMYGFMQNSYNQARSGDVYISLAPGWVERASAFEEESLLSFSSIYRYDQHVPLIWYGWKVGRKTINTPVSLYDIAPTLADFLQIAWPNATLGKPIQMLTE